MRTKWIEVREVAREAIVGPRSARQSLAGSAERASRHLAASHSRPRVAVRTGLLVELGVASGLFRLPLELRVPSEDSSPLLDAMCPVLGRLDD